MSENMLSQSDRIRAYHSIIKSRADLAGAAGLQYGGERDIYKTLGYKQRLSFADFYSRYRRQDIAGAIIDRPVDDSWRERFSVVESSDAEKTKLETDYNTLAKKISLHTKLKRLDKLTMLGQYGVLLIGFSDTKTTKDYEQEAQKGSDVLYVKPLSQDSAKIYTYDTDPTSSRYGLPLLYSVNLGGEDYESSVTLIVHYTRVIHVAYNLLESEVYGVPEMERVFNRLMDIEKLVGSSAEMFWRGARPGYQGKVDQDYNLSGEDEEKLKEQMDEYENHLRRLLINQGVTWESLQQQIADPGNHVDVQITMISAITKIPKRMLMGSERGELSSSQDESNWMKTIQSRREESINEKILHPLIQRLMNVGVLPESDTWYIEWPDPFSKGEAEQADIGTKRATALKQYASEIAAQEVIPPAEFLKYFLGLSDEQIEMIEEARQNAIQEEQQGFEGGEQ